MIERDCTNAIPDCKRKRKQKCRHSLRDAPQRQSASFDAKTTAKIINRLEFETQLRYNNTARSDFVSMLSGGWITIRRMARGVDALRAGRHYILFPLTTVILSRSILSVKYNFFLRAISFLRSLSLFSHFLLNSVCGVKYVATVFENFRICVMSIFFVRF
jgi:hypothetical protein